MAQTQVSASQCLSVPNQRILTGPSGIFDTLLGDSAMTPFMQTIGNVSQFTISPTLGGVGLEVVLLEGYGFEGFANQLQEVGYIREGVTLGRNVVVSTIEGSGHSPSQSPFGAQPTFIPNNSNDPNDPPIATSDGFQNQWALQTISQTQLYQAYESNRGIGVNLAVFDTSPFSFVVTPFSPTVPIIASDLTGDKMETTVFIRDILGPSRDSWGLCFQFGRPSCARRQPFALSRLKRRWHWQCLLTGTTDDKFLFGYALPTSPG